MSHSTVSLDQLIAVYLEKHPPASYERYGDYELESTKFGDVVHLQFYIKNKEE